MPTEDVTFLSVMLAKLHTSSLLPVAVLQHSMQLPAAGVPVKVECRPRSCRGRRRLGKRVCHSA